MHSKQSLFVTLTVFLGISMAIASERNAWVDQQNNLNLMSFMARSNNVMQRNPSRSLDCFNYYIPWINQIAEKYQENFNACLKTSESSRAQADAATLVKRNELSSKASTSCELLTNCSEMESAEKVFECFVNGGSENAKTMYAINVDASESLVELKENLRLIQTSEFKCTNETKRTYEKESTKAYDEFNSCVLGLTEVPKPTDPPATDAPATEPPATNPPATDPPATEAPEVPESPEVAPEDKLPEEDIDIPHRAVRSRFQNFNVSKRN